MKFRDRRNQTLIVVPPNFNCPECLLAGQCSDWISLSPQLIPQIDNDIRRVTLNVIGDCLKCKSIAMPVGKDSDVEV